jgi:hypothetical protein
MGVPVALNDRLASQVLVLLDRNLDLVPMIAHSWTYQSLVHDVMDLKLNRVTFNVHSTSQQLTICHADQTE